MEAEFLDACEGRELDLVRHGGGEIPTRQETVAPRGEVDMPVGCRSRDHSRASWLTEQIVVSDGEAILGIGDQVGYAFSVRGCDGVRAHVSTA
jgi:hypothetical protein